MKRNKGAEAVSRLLQTAVALALALLLIWYITLPEKDYEPKPNQVGESLISGDIDVNGISQSLKAEADFRGIRVRWGTHRTTPENGVTAYLFRANGDTLAGTVEIPASEIRDNEETDIVFAGEYAPGDYLIRLSVSPESRDRIAVWESADNSYLDGSAFNRWGEDEGRDWAFHLLNAFPESMMNRHRIGKAAGVALTLLVFGISIAWIYGAGRLRQRKHVLTAFRFIKGNADRILVALLILIPTLAYLDFLTGDRLYVFTMLDRGADSAAQTYPSLLDTAARVRNGLWGELFNFRLGLGDAQASFFPTLTTWVTLFGESAVARLLAVSQWAKVVLSGLFAWLFAREYGARTIGRFAIALGYCFNSMLIARGAWESYPNIALLVILWMYAYERRLNGKGTLLYLFSSLFTFINLGLYDCVFYAVLLPCYMLVRRVLKEETARKTIRAFARDVGLFAVFALAGMGDTVRYLLARTLSSSRMTEGISSYGESVSAGIFSEAGIWMTAFLRTVGHSISGIIYHTGPLNLLEGPAFYTGITAFLTAPVALCLMKGRKKRIYLFFVLCAFCYIALVPLRLVANGFAKETFKLSSFWITLLLTLLATDYFSAGDRYDRKRTVYTAAGITVAAVLILLVLAKSTGYVASGNAWTVTFGLVILYLILILLRLRNRDVSLIRFLTVWCLIAEAALVPAEMIHDRNMENSKNNSRTERAATEEIISSLPQNEWYRIEKDYFNVYLSDSLAEGYRSSPSYLGGIEINRSVQDIYEANNLPRGGNHYLYGSGGNIRFESAEGARYLLAKNEVEFRYGYRLKEIRNGIRVYENQYAYPLAYISPYREMTEDPKEIDQSGRRMGYELAKNVYLFGQLPEGSVVVMEAEFDLDDNGTLYLQDREGHFASVPFQAGPKTRIELTNDKLFSLWMDEGSRRRLQNISFLLFDREEYYRTYREKSEYAKGHAVQFESMEENRFAGTVSAENDEYIITAIPYDRKWKIRLDGQEQETFTVNSGFLGAAVPAGEHRIEIVYAGDSWFTGNLFKLAGFGAFILAVFMIKSKKEQKRSRGANENQ